MLPWLGLCSGVLYCALSGLIVVLAEPSPTYGFDDTTTHRSSRFAGEKGRCHIINFVSPIALNESLLRLMGRMCGVSWRGFSEREERSIDVKTTCVPHDPGSRKLVEAQILSGRARASPSGGSGVAGPFLAECWPDAADTALVKDEGLFLQGCTQAFGSLPIRDTLPI